MTVVLILFCFVLSRDGEVVYQMSDNGLRSGWARGVAEETETK